MTKFLAPAAGLAVNGEPFFPLHSLPNAVILLV